MNRIFVGSATAATPTLLLSSQTDAQQRITSVPAGGTPLVPDSQVNGPVPRLPDGHPDDLLRSWYGHSIGRWEGDTLVVDTVGYKDKFWFDSRGTAHTEKLHTIERLSRPNFGTLVNDFTVEDPGAYSKTVLLKFTARRVRQDVELVEDICTENNQAGIAGGYKLNPEQK